MIYQPSPSPQTRQECSPISHLPRSTWLRSSWTARRSLRFVLRFRSAETICASGINRSMALGHSRTSARVRSALARKLSRLTSKASFDRSTRGEIVDWKVVVRACGASSRSTHACPFPRLAENLHPSASQDFSFSACPQKTLANPTAGIYNQCMAKERPIRVASWIARRIRSVAFALCYATGGPMRFSQAQRSEPFPPTANCRNINMATTSTDRLSLT
jgi:hypothetical protein